ncbi:hypothetical protein [Afifella pfennigii]|uniref:hypothetical protein n=1 Tax=Afifella pfennigii TaxID=209897 RepID=UPI00047CCA6C|nr:hypothetical protein [Afifella pfennigii]
MRITQVRHPCPELTALMAAETRIVELIACERAALREGRLLAARAYATQLRDAASAYLTKLREARACLSNAPDPATLATEMERRRRTFADILRVELAALASSRILSTERLRAAKEKAGEAGIPSGPNLGMRQAKPAAFSPARPRAA